MNQIEKDVLDALVAALTPMVKQVVAEGIADVKADLEAKITAVPDQAAGLIKTLVDDAQQTVSTDVANLIAQIPGVAPVENLLKAIGL
jgi:hypothetical protein